MITDEMLKEAAGELERQMTEAAPAEHTFSDNFNRRVNRAKRRATQPVMQTAMRGVAAVLLVCLTVFGVLFASVPEVRAFVADWYRSDYREWSASGRIPAEERVEYCLTYIPEGSKFVDAFELNGGETILYIDSNGKYFRFLYWYDGTVSNTVNGYKQKIVTLGDVTAEIFLSPYEDEGSTILWKEESGGVAFSITAFADEEELIRLALSVQEKK